MRYLSLLLLITSTSIFSMHHEKLDVIVFAIDLEIVEGQKIILGTLFQESLTM